MAARKVDPGRPIVSQRAALVRRITEAIAAGEWDSAASLALQAETGVTASELRAATSESYRALGVMMARDKEDWRATFVCALDALRRKATDAGQYGHAVRAIDVSTRLFGLQAVEVVQSGDPTRLGDKELLARLEAEQSARQEQIGLLRARVADPLPQIETGSDADWGLDD